MSTKFIEAEEANSNHYNQSIRLLYLYHACQCKNPPNQCPVTPQCWLLQNLWGHMLKPCAGSLCQFQHCKSSKNVLLHFSDCRDSNCLVCGPVRDASKLSIPVLTDIKNLSLCEDVLPSKKRKAVDFDNATEEFAQICSKQVEDDVFAKSELDEKLGLVVNALLRTRTIRHDTSAVHECGLPLVVHDISDGEKDQNSERMLTVNHAGDVVKQSGEEHVYHAIEGASDDDEMTCIPKGYGGLGSPRRNFAYPSFPVRSYSERKQWDIDMLAATLIREDRFIALCSSVIKVLTPAQQLLLNKRFYVDDEEMRRWMKMCGWIDVLMNDPVTHIQLYAVYEGVFKNNPDYDSSLFMRNLSMSDMRSHLDRHRVRSTADDDTDWYNNYVKVLRSSGETYREIVDPVYRALCEEYDHKEIEEKALKARKDTAASLYRLSLEDEDRRKRARKESARKSYLLDEESEEEEEDCQRVLGDFGFGNLTTMREIDESNEEKALMRLIMDNIVDDVSEGESDEEEYERQRVANEIREDHERTQAVIEAVTEGRLREAEAKLRLPHQSDESSPSNAVQTAAPSAASFDRDEESQDWSYWQE